MQAVRQYRQEEDKMYETHGGRWLLIDHAHGGRVIGDVVGVEHSHPYWNTMDPDDFPGVAFAPDPEDDDELGGWSFEGECYDYFDFEVVCVGTEIRNFNGEMMDRLAAEGKLIDLGEYGAIMYAMLEENGRGKYEVYLFGVEQGIERCIATVQKDYDLSQIIEAAHDAVAFWARYRDDSDGRGYADAMEFLRNTRDVIHRNRD